MNEKVNYKLLLLSRQLRGLTQKDASRKLGISQGRLSKLEHGLQDIPMESIEAFASVYNFPPAFFFQESINTLSKNSYFRRKVSIP